MRIGWLLVSLGLVACSRAAEPEIAPTTASAAETRAPEASRVRAGSSPSAAVFAPTPAIARELVELSLVPRELALPTTSDLVSDGDALLTIRLGLAGEDDVLLRVPATGEPVEILRRPRLRALAAQGGSVLVSSDVGVELLGPEGATRVLASEPSVVGVMDASTACFATRETYVDAVMQPDARIVCASRTEPTPRDVYTALTQVIDLALVGTELVWVTRDAATRTAGFPPGYLVRGSLDGREAERTRFPNGGLASGNRPEEIEGDAAGLYAIVEGGDDAHPDRIARLDPGATTWEVLAEAADARHLRLESDLLCWLSVVGLEEHTLRCVASRGGPVRAFHAPGAVRSLALLPGEIAWIGSAIYRAAGRP